VRTVSDAIERDLRFAGRELSWDKAWLSRYLASLLNEYMYRGRVYSSGLKAFISMHDLDHEEVDTAASLEGNAFSKAQGAIGARCDPTLAYGTYLFILWRERWRLGMRGGEGTPLTLGEELIWSFTPIALGGGGGRTMLQLASTESSPSTAEGVATLVRLAAHYRELAPKVNAIVNAPLEQLGPLDFLRDATQFHVQGPRIRTQRVPQAIRRALPTLARNPNTRTLIKEVDLQTPTMEKVARTWQQARNVSATEVSDYYRMSPLHDLDALVTKFASSSTVRGLLQPHEIRSLRIRVRRDLVDCIGAFKYRLMGRYSEALMYSCAALPAA
jgi:hypothetical protein